MQRLEDRDVVALLHEVARTGEAARAGADDSDLVAVGRRHDGAGAGVVGVLHVVVGHEALQAADGDRLALYAAHALALALALLRTDAAADRGEGVGRGDDLIAALEVALLDLGDELGDADVDGAALDALGVLAGEAALCLALSHGRGVAERDLVEVLGADDGVLLRHRVLGHALGGVGLGLGGRGLVLAAAHAAGDAADVLVLVALLIEVEVVALQQAVPVDEVGVELGAVHAGELALAADCEAAAAAHAGAVYHDGVQAGVGLQAVGAGDLGDVLHHDDRTAGEHAVVLHAGLEQGLELVGDETGLAVAAVVGAYVEVVAGGAELVLHDDDVLAAEAADHVHADAEALELLGDGVVDGAAGAAADHADALGVGVDLSGAAEGADDVGNIVAGLHEREHLRALARRLEVEGDRADLGVIVRYGERETLAELVESEDGKLAGLRALCDERRLNTHAKNRFGRIERVFFSYLEHSFLLRLSMYELPVKGHRN